MKDKESWSTLPLFPLHTVLFPSMVLPLHIFEERYKLMINRCLEEERPFGVVLIREGEEVGSHAVPYDVGTTLVIEAVTRYDDGRMNILGLGNERFRLRKLQYDQPYLLADVEPWPLLSDDRVLARRQVEPMRALIRQYFTLLALAQGPKINVEEVPEEPRALALLIAIALQLPSAQKQALLNQPSVAELLLAERVILRREQLLLNQIIQTQQEQWEGGYSGYLARN
jgi:Lon protease-like protein